jgi:hypothetical protein
MVVSYAILKSELITHQRFLGKSLKALPAPVPGGVAGEVELQELPWGQGSEHFLRKLIK